MNAPTGTPASPPARIGGRYLLQERIGAGAMGAVWRGTDELLNRTVAVKELLAAMPAAGPGAGEGLEEARQRIMREGRIGARLQHPHVISTFDVVLHDDRPWLVMEYLPSQSLATVLAEAGTLPPREVAGIGRQVADGLAAAHAAGVVHRDVKPGNVLLAEDGRVKLTDFGVSRAVDDVQLTRTGLIAGTPAFLAPEIARGREPSTASDVFALGATLYAAVEGRPPFGLDDNAYALLHRVATGAVDPPRQAGPLTALLMRLLATDPGERPTAAQARDALAVVASGGAPALAPTPTAVLEAPRTVPIGDGRADRPVPPATVVGVPPRPGGRPRWLVPMAVFAVLLLAGVGAGVLLATTSERGVPPAPGSSVPAAPLPNSPTSSVAPPSTQTIPATPPAGTDDVAFVQHYYSLLPRDTDAAWELLSDDARAASRGKDRYEEFWAGIDRVALEDVRAVGDGTVEATVVFDPFDGPTSRERYRFVVGNEDGEPILASFDRR